MRKINRKYTLVNEAVRTQGHVVCVDDRYSFWRMYKTEWQLVPWRCCSLFELAVMLLERFSVMWPSQQSKLPHHLYSILQVGCQPRIPADETILFELYVVSFIDVAAAVDYDNLDEQSQCAATFQEKLEAARAFHRQVSPVYFFLPSFILTRACWLCIVTVTECNLISTYSTWCADKPTFSLFLCSSSCLLSNCLAIKNVCCSHEGSYYDSQTHFGLSSFDIFNVKWHWNSDMLSILKPLIEAANHRRVNLDGCVSGFMHDVAVLNFCARFCEVLLLIFQSLTSSCLYLSVSLPYVSVDVSLVSLSSSYCSLCWFERRF